MEQKYIYRALNPVDLYSNAIHSKCYTDYCPYSALYESESKLGRNALDSVENHISKGCKVKTSWISCTKDYSIASKYMNVDIDGNHDKHYSNGIAFIKNHNQDILECEELAKLFHFMHEGNLSNEDFIKLLGRIRNIPFQNIKKLVFDFSTGNSMLFELLIQSGFVFDSQGRTVLRTGKITHNYSKSSKEVLVLNKIPSNECYMCSPLVLDIIDYLYRQGIIVDESQVTEDFLVHVIADLKIFFSYLLFSEDCKAEDILNPTLLKSYILLPFDLQNLLVDLYINIQNKNYYCLLHHLTLEDLLKKLDILFEIIINNSEFLRDFCQKTKESFQLLNLTF